jgi:hypothetical protein
VRHVKFEEFTSNHRAESLTLISGVILSKTTRYVKKNVGLALETRNTCEIIGGKAEQTRPLKRRMHRFEDNIKIDLEIF